MSKDLSPNLQQAMSDFEDDWAGVEPDTGGGPDANFPPGGVHEVDLVGYETKDSTMRYRLPDGTQAEVPSALLRFVYEWELPPDHPNYVEGRDNHKRFSGSFIEIVSPEVAKTLPEQDNCKQQTRVRIQWQALRGAEEVLLRGETTGDAFADLTAALEEIPDEAAIPLTIQVKENQYNGNTYKEERMKERLD